MLFFVALVSAEHQLNIGFTSFPVSKSQIFQYKHPNGTLVIPPRFPLILETIHSKEKTKSMNVLEASDSIQIIGVNANISSVLSGEKIVKTWYLPNNFCPPGSIFTSADHKIDFVTNTSSLFHDFCIFPQINTIAQYVEGSFTSPAPNCTIEFYDSSVFNINSPTYLSNTYVPFRYTFNAPYFIRFNKCKKQSLSVSMKIYVSRNDIKSEDCFIRTIPSISNQGGALLRNPMGDFDLECKSAAESYLKVISVFFVFSLIVLGVILFCFMIPMYKKRNHVMFTPAF